MESSLIWRRFIAAPWRVSYFGRSCSAHSLLLTLILGWSDAAVLTSDEDKDNFILTAGIFTHPHTDHVNG